MIIRDDDVFDYHEKPRPGKLEVVTSKPCLTQLDLSIAYTPGVARPCLAIERSRWVRHGLEVTTSSFPGRGFS